MAYTAFGRLTEVSRLSNPLAARALAQQVVAKVRFFLNLGRFQGKFLSWDIKKLWSRRAAFFIAKRLSLFILFVCADASVICVSLWRLINGFI
jgi:hypothetical protein